MHLPHQIRINSSCDVFFCICFFLWVFFCCNLIVLVIFFWLRLIFKITSILSGINYFLTMSALRRCPRYRRPCDHYLFLSLFLPPLISTPFFKRVLRNKTRFSWVLVCWLSYPFALFEAFYFNCFSFKCKTFSPKSFQKRFTFHPSGPWYNVPRVKTIEISHFKAIWGLINVISNLPWLKDLKEANIRNSLQKRSCSNE